MNEPLRLFTKQTHTWALPVASFYSGLTSLNYPNKEPILKSGLSLSFENNQSVLFYQVKTFKLKDNIKNTYHLYFLVPRRQTFWRQKFSVLQAYAEESQDSESSLLPSKHHHMHSGKTLWFAVCIRAYKQIKEQDIFILHIKIDVSLSIPRFSQNGSWALFVRLIWTKEWEVAAAWS